MRATTKAFVVDAWSGTWTLEKALAHRAPECTQTMLPTSQGAKPLGNDEWAAYFKKMEGKVWDAKVKCFDCRHGRQPTDRRPDGNVRVHCGPGSEKDRVLL